MVDVLESTKLLAVANQRQQDVHFEDFTVSKWSESDYTPVGVEQESNSEVRQVGFSRAWFVPLV